MEFKGAPIDVLGHVQCDLGPESQSLASDNDNSPAGLFARQRCVRALIQHCLSAACSPLHCALQQLC